jgi:hypothetical protein
MTLDDAIHRFADSLMEQVREERKAVALRIARMEAKHRALIAEIKEEFAATRSGPGLQHGLNHGPPSSIQLH